MFSVCNYLWKRAVFPWKNSLSSIEVIPKPSNSKVMLCSFHPVLQLLISYKGKTPSLRTNIAKPKQMLLHILTWDQSLTLGVTPRKRTLLSKENPRTQIFTTEISVEIHLKKQLEFKNSTVSFYQPFHLKGQTALKIFILI